SLLFPADHLHRNTWHHALPMGGGYRVGVGGAVWLRQPRLTAQIAAWVRSATPSVAKTRSRWVFTVAWPIPSRPAMSRFESPWLRRSRTSRSRRVSEVPPGRASGAGVGGSVATRPMNDRGSDGAISDPPATVVRLALA